MVQLPETGYLRLVDVIGDRARGIPALIPVSKTTWWNGCRTGKFPKPIKLGPRTTAWRVEDVRFFIASARAEER
jgi:predicted DNA-binding transcriptional regulator AlpA